MVHASELASRTSKPVFVSVPLVEPAPVVVPAVLVPDPLDLVLDADKLLYAEEL